MRYANSVGDFGGLTSYDAHFFFYYLFSSFCYFDLFSFYIPLLYVAQSAYPLYQISNHSNVCHKSQCVLFEPYLEHTLYVYRLDLDSLITYKQYDDYRANV